ncbi:hypothetical protein C8Q80DRAFT_1274642 [Daedaleopsis nitida]|nr:hypothetical protein C8Q80DRAFT_1274642 [Daedaleopsis nitida]
MFKFAAILALVTLAVANPVPQITIPPIFPSSSSSKAPSVTDIPGDISSILSVAGSAVSSILKVLPTGTPEATTSSAILPLPTIVIPSVSLPAIPTIISLPLALETDPAIPSIPLPVSLPSVSLPVSVPSIPTSVSIPNLSGLSAPIN